MRSTPTTRVRLRCDTLFVQVPHAAGAILTVAGGDERFVESGVTEVVRTKDPPDRLDRLRGIASRAVGGSQKYQRMVDKCPTTSKELAKPPPPGNTEDHKKEHLGKDSF